MLLNANNVNDYFSIGNNPIHKSYMTKYVNYMLVENRMVHMKISRAKFYSN